jgi:hypothetical protein
VGQAGDQQAREIMESKSPARRRKRVMKVAFNDILAACGDVLFFFSPLHHSLIFPAQTVSSVPATEA